MKAKWFFMLIVLVAFGCAAIYLAACGDDDDDDNDDSEDDDDEATWEERCDTFVTDYYAGCTEGLFDLTEAEAVDSCTNLTFDLPWECVVDCWDESDGCGSWYDCIMENCDIPSGDDDDDDATTTDDDDAAGPQVADVDHTTCKDGSKDKNDWPESVEFDYSDDALTVTHVNGVFNCCLESIDVTLDLTDLVLTLYEVEYTPMPCDCICPYDVVTQIEDLDAGDYTVNVYVNGSLAISADTVIP